MTTTEMRVAERYRLGQSLGVGGMGRVWLARDEVLHRDVAIKEVALPFGLADDERAELRSRTLREARAAARLNHPNVVRIYDVVQSEEQPWIVMEYVRSRSLLQVVKDDGPLDVVRVAEIGLAVLSALEAANKVGVLHRDVKPSNVLLGDGRVVLTDFGSAMLDDSEGAITRTGVLLGSPQYMAPERVRNGESTMESDLWSLGASMYVAVEGRSPFSRPTALATLIAVATERPDPPRLAGPLKPVLSGLLQKNPRARMDIAEVERRLKRIVEGHTAAPVAVPNRRPRRDVPAEAAVEAVPATPPQTASDAAVPVVIPAAAVVAAEAPPAGPPETPEVGSRSDAPRRRLVAAGAAVVVLAAVATAAFVVRTADRSRTEAGRGQPIAVTVPTGSSTHGPAPAPVNPDVVPAGLALYTDPVGFRVGVPAGWNTQREAPTVMFFCEPKGPRTLRVKLWDPTDPDLAVALAKDEAMEKSMLMGYQRIRIDVLPGEAGAEWEYTFDDEMMGGLTHGVDRVVMVAGRSYLLEWRTPPAEWQANLPMYNSIVTSFRPPKLTMMTAS